MQQTNDPYGIGEFINNDEARKKSGDVSEKNESTITVIQMSDFTFEDQDSVIEIVDEEAGCRKNEKFFKINLDTEAKFELDSNDWAKLKSLQMGHRFQKGEWEDYFVSGMKQSNKYCVFAFKDHYVNRACLRKRKASMNTLNNPNIVSEGDEKIFTAKGYCVFEDCSIKFSLKMNAQRVVYVSYTGELKHSMAHVNGRYFRGKSRDELKEILKRTQKPKKEFMNRKESLAKRNLLESNNVDYIGKTYSVYKRISSEAKDWCHTLLALQNEFIDRDEETSSSNECFVKGYIQTIQVLPSCIICFEKSQKVLFEQIFNSNHRTASSEINLVKTPAICLYISCCQNKSLISTKLNKKIAQFYEICLRKDDENNNSSLIPLSALFKTDSTSKDSYLQWLNTFFDVTTVFKPKNIIFGLNTLYIICDNSMALVESIIEKFTNKSFNNYASNCFRKAFSLKQSTMNMSSLENAIISSSHIDTLNKELLLEYENSFNENNIFLFVHTCTNQFMNEMKNLSNFYFSKNVNFAMSLFSVLANSQTLIEFEHSLAAFMCILYSKYSNKVVKNALDFFKLRTGQAKKKFENQNLNIESIDSFIGLRAFKHNTRQSEFFLSTEKDEDNRLDELNKNSIFFKMCEKLFEKIKLICDQDVTEDELSNVYMGHELLYYFLRRFGYCIPLWVNKNVFLGENQLLPNTLKIHDQRYKKLKETLSPNENQKESIDNLIKYLYNESMILIKPLLTETNENRDKDLQSIIRLIPASPLDILVSENGTTSNRNCSDLTNSSIKLITNFNDQALPVITKTLMATNKKVKKLKTSKTSDKQIEHFNDNVKQNDEIKKVAFDNKDDHTQEEEEIVIRRSHQILTNAFGLEVSRDDIDSLENSNLPNSNIIEFYLKYLETNKNSFFKKKEVCVLPVRFYPTLKYSQTIANASKDSDIYIEYQNFGIFEYNLALIPIHKTSTDHWALAAIDLKKKSLTYYDSSLNDDNDCLKYLKDFLDVEYFRFYQRKIDFSDWKFTNEKNISKQKSQRDCAIFLLLYAKSLIENESLLFEEYIIDTFVNQLKNEINDLLNR